MLRFFRYFNFNIKIKLFFIVKNRVIKKIKKIKKNFFANLLIDDIKFFLLLNY